MRKWRAALLLLFLCSQTFFLTGCWNRIEINDLAIITAAGFDLTQDEKVEITVNLFLTHTQGNVDMMGGSSGPGGSTPQSLVQSASGINLADALSKLQQILSRNIFWGQNEVFIFGETLARRELIEPMDFLTRHPAPRERANVFVSKGSAKEVLKLQPPVERNLAEVLRELAKTQTGLNITVKELAQMMAGKASAAVIPLVEIKKQEKIKIPIIKGTAIVKNGRMIGRMDDVATRGVLWLRNEIKKATVTVTPEDKEGYVSFELLKSHTELTPHIEGNEWSITAKIDTLDDIVENTTSINLLDTEQTKRLEEKLADDLVNRVNLALTRAQKEMKADIFNFADVFYRKYPKEWNQVKDRWDEIYPQVKVKVEAHPNITRPGLTGKNFLKRN
ncbi:MAG: Ger(x)C family spore germination protein [Brevibacillus sp.]|nr:Ger(x)C family spore germination protein [Brevibacillus sp.]